MQGPGTEAQDHPPFVQLRTAGPYKGAHTVGA